MYRMSREVIKYKRPIMDDLLQVPWSICMLSSNYDEVSLVIA